MAKTLPNINKPVPEASDPALIKPVSDAIEAVDQAIGAKPSTLATTAKTIVPAVNEIKGRVDTIEANSSLLTASGDLIGWIMGKLPTVGLIHFYTSNATGVPNGFSYCHGLAMRSGAIIQIIIYGRPHAAKMALNFSNSTGSSWDGWGTV